MYIVAQRVYSGATLSITSMFELTHWGQRRVESDGAGADAVVHGVRQRQHARVQRDGVVLQAQRARVQRRRPDRVVTNAPQSHVH
jgi:hypothetical protein